MFKNIFLGGGLVVMATLSTVAKADDFGCKAVLCFAGGKGLSECASTISEVKKRLAKGKGFPSCSFVDANGSQSDLVKQTGKFTRKLGRRNNVCPDGTVTNWYKDRNYKCNAITVTFKGINEDGTDKVMEINWL